MRYSQILLSAVLSNPVDLHCIVRSDRRSVKNAHTRNRFKSGPRLRDSPCLQLYFFLTNSLLYWVRYGCPFKSTNLGTTPVFSSSICRASSTLRPSLARWPSTPTGTSPTSTGARTTSPSPAALSTSATECAPRPESSPVPSPVGDEQSYDSSGRVLWFG